MSLSKIASFDDNEKSFNIHDVEIPTLNGGEILVKIIYTTICRSDLYTFEGKRKEKSPTILGHEIVGRVVSFGNDINQLDIRGALLKKDDRITWGIYASNPLSIYSKRGIPQKAEDLFKYGHEQITNGNTLHGGLAEYIILRKNTPVIKISDELSDEVSALINCSVATVAAAFRMAGDVAGKNIVVCGVGMLGTIACAMASWIGAKNILSIDNNIDRLNKSKEFGSTNTVLNSDSTVELKKNIQQSIREEFNNDIVLEFSGVPSAVEATLGLLDIGGTAVWVGSTFTQPSISVSAEQIVRKLITIKGIHNYNQDDLLSAVEFMEQSHTKFNFQSLIKGGFKLEDTQAAFEYALKENPFRVGIQIS